MVRINRDTYVTNKTIMRMINYTNICIIDSNKIIVLMSFNVS